MHTHYVLLRNLTAGLLLLAAFAPLSAQSDTDAPLQPLEFPEENRPTTTTTDSASSTGAQGDTISGLEVYSVPPGKNLVLRFDAEDDISGVDDLFVKINDDPFRRIMGREVRLREDGLYKISYYTTDKAGNVASARYRNILIDSTAPVVRHVLMDSARAEDGAVDNNAKLALQASDPATGLKGILYKVGDGDWQDYGSPINLGTSGGEGKNVIYYKAVDRAGNETAPNSFAWYVDNTPPDMPEVLDDGQDPIRVTQQGIKVPPYEKGARMYYKLNDGNYEEVMPGDEINLPRNGKHTITFRIVDQVGNAREKTYNIEADFTPPRTEIRPQT